MASSKIKSRLNSVTLTNKSTSAEGLLIINEIPRYSTVLPSRLLNDENGHLMIPVGSAYSTAGYCMCALLDSITKEFSTAQISVSGVLNYTV